MTTTTGDRPSRAKVIPPEVWDKYFDLIRAGCSKSDAAKMLQLSAPLMSKRMNQDPELLQRFNEAWADSADDLIEEAVRRGKDGWLEPIVQGGKHVVDAATGEPLYVRKYDSNLLMFNIKARRPDFRDTHKQDIVVQVGMKFEDRSAALEKGWAVLEAAGIGRGTPQRELPSAQEVLAEPSDVQR